MMRSVFIAVTGMLLLAAAQPAGAQISLGPIVGAATAHIGTASGTDGQGTTLSFGGSLAAVESTGWGAELDAGVANDDDGRSGGLDVQSYMANVIGVWPKGRLRPFGTAGVGVLHAHTCTAGCVTSSTWTDWGISGGGGVFYFFSEAFGLRGDARYFSTVGRDNGVGFWRISVGATFLWSAD
jgi:hypothetical protein